MVAPLVGLGIGLAYGAGRSLLRRRKNASLREAVEATYGAGQMGADGMGPPTPGQSVLRPEQLAGIRMLPPEMQWAEAVRMSQGNAIQARFDANQEIAGEQLQLSKDQLAQQKHQNMWNVALKNQELATTAWERAQLQERANNPQLAHDYAVTHGEDTYPTINPITQQRETAPTRGTDDFMAGQRAIEVQSNAINKIRDLAEIYITAPREELVNTQSPVRARAEALEKDLQVYMKEVLRLGALQTVDMPFVTTAIPEGTDPVTYFSRNPTTLLASLATTSENIARTLEQDLVNTAGWRGFDPGIRERAQNAIRGAQSIGGITQDRIERGDELTGETPLIDVPAEQAYDQIPSLLMRIPFLNTLVEQGFRSAGGVGNVAQDAVGVPTRIRR